MELCQSTQWLWERYCQPWVPTHWPWYSACTSAAELRSTRFCRLLPRAKNVAFIAIALMVAETRDFAADLREQRGFAQQLVQVTLVEIVARAGPAYIERIFADLELASLLAQVVHVFHQVAERRVCLATLLGEGVALQQALPKLATQIVDGP